MSAGSISRTSLRTLWLAGAATGLIATSAVAEAQTAADENSGQLEDIIVTAQRRSENLQNAAISVTAVSGEQLARNGITRLEDLNRVAPALQTLTAAGPYPVFSMRGIYTASTNQFADSGVATAVDGIFLARPFASHGMFYDLERVEVLKGPQGTLYGRNSTGGAINFISRAPQLGTTGGDALLEVGNYGMVHATGAANMPVGDTAALRVAFNAITRGGYMSDGTSDDKGWAGRAGFRWEPSSDLSLILRGDYAKQGGKGPGATGLLDTGRAGSPWTSIVDQPFLLNCPISDVAYGLPGCQPGTPLSRSDYLDNRFAGVSAQLDWRLPIGGLTVVAGYRSSDVDYISNLAGYYIDEVVKSDQLSVEARLSSSGDAALGYLIGAFYMQDDSVGQAFYEAQVQGRTNDNAYDHDGHTWAAFGQLTWKVAPRVKLTGGLRYTYEKKSVNDTSKSVRYFQPDGSPPFSGPPPICFAGTTQLADGSCLLFALDRDRDWNNVTAKGGVEWDVADRSLLYANVATGFKAGGFYFGPPSSSSYDVEKVTSYTVGSKNMLLDGRLRLNGEAFLLKFDGQQIGGVLTQIGSAVVSRVVNAGKSSSYGAEIEAEFAVTPDTRLSGQMQYLRAKFDSLAFDLANPGFLAPPAYACPITPTPIAPAGTPYRVDCGGFDQLQSPRWTLRGGIDQTLRLPGGGSIVASLESQYESARFANISYLPQTRVGANTRTNLSLTYRPASGAWDISAYVRNLENDAVYNNVVPAFGYVQQPPGISGGLHYFSASVRPPRMYGVRLASRF